MSETNRPAVWQMVREAVGALGGETTNVKVRDWILDKYPGTNLNTIQCQIIVCTVNHLSRIHYPENRRARPATSNYDFLFRPTRGHLQLYDPAEHGTWEIRQADDGSLQVQLANAVEVPDGGDESEGHAFAAEAHLRDYLAAHLEDVEPGLQLYVEDDDVDGVEYITTIGRIDLLTKDRAGRFVVIELKVSDGPDSVCGQLLRYMGWVKRHLADGADVRGIIIAQSISDKIRYAPADVANVELREYEIALRLQKVPPLDRN